MKAASTCKGTCKKPKRSKEKLSEAEVVGTNCAPKRKYIAGGCPGTGIFCCPYAEVDPVDDPVVSVVDTVVDTQSKITTTYKGDRKANVELIIRHCVEHGITNPLSIVGMLCVIGKETHFKVQSERMSYSKGRLAEVWSRFCTIGNGKTAPKGQGEKYANELAEQYARNSEKLANFVYCCRYGNGDEKSGDGWRYRGRGFNQITFKGTYKKYSKLLNVDLVNDPDKLNEPDIAADAAILFLKNRFEQQNIDPNDFDDVDEALQKWAAANAGWGKSPNKAIRSSRKELEKFTVTDSTWFE